MRFLPTRVHGVIDYIVGAILVLVPNVFGFADGTAAQWIFVALGLAAIVYSLVTDYERGLIPLIPMLSHLGLDAASGLLVSFAMAVRLPRSRVSAASDLRPGLIAASLVMRTGSRELTAAA